jgi:hypothetical protein
MAQAISGRPLTAEARVGARVSVCGICGGESGTRIDFFSEFFGSSPVNIIPPWMARQWPQIGDKISVHRHEQQHDLQASACTLVPREKHCVNILNACIQRGGI